MANCMMGFPNNIDLATLSGGSYAASLPLNNLLTRKLQQVARSSNLTLANTQFVIDQGMLRNVRALAIVNHNFSVFAKYRIVGTNDGTFATLAYDGGWKDVWPLAYPYGTLEWEDPNWWGGRYSPEQAEGYMTTLVHILPQNSLYRYWRVEVDDTTNGDGFVQFGRVFLGPVWQPDINMSYGASIAWETDTEVQKAQGGAEYFTEKTPYRTMKYKFEHITKDQALAHAMEIQRRAGISKEVLFIMDPDDTTHSLRTQFLGRLRALSPIEFPYYNTNSTAFEIKELQ